MEQTKDEKPASQSCGPDCSCNTKKGLPLCLKIILLTAIIFVAGSVLASSLLKKVHTTKNKQANSYASALSLNKNQSSVSPSQKKDLPNSTSVKPGASLTALFSFASLDTVANRYNGVFVLVENMADNKSVSRINEISQAAQSIGTRGINIGTFQLYQASPDFKVISSQLPPPCVVVLIKGRGMFGIDSANINRQKILQACLTAMQPRSCCPAGGNKVCK